MAEPWDEVEEEEEEEEGIAEAEGVGAGRGDMALRRLTTLAMPVVAAA